MGIPSFYRQICRRFPHLISVQTPQTDWLCLDFNCAMYHVLREYKHKTATQPTPSSATQWEAGFIDAITQYMSDIIAVGNPKQGCYVSCDGAVCAAKRRQQRLRRFKGPWITALEANVKANASAGQQTTNTTNTHNDWDQNALTPGTAFMTALGNALTVAGQRIAEKRGIQVIVSTTAEAGEGEHKIMRFVRSATSVAVFTAPLSITIYGLDADLILLAMLLHADTGFQVHLLREAQEFQLDDGDAWRTLDIVAFLDALLDLKPNQQHQNQIKTRYIYDFVAAMTLLGNDFLPRSLTRTVYGMKNNNGIQSLVRDLHELWNKNLFVVEANTVSVAGLLELLKGWSRDEPALLYDVACEALRKSRYPSRVGDTPEETALNEWQSQPSRWATVTQLLDTTATTGLSYRWKTVYDSWHPGNAKQYLLGVAWVLDYYSGKPVDQAWCFEEHLPPLWSDVVAELTAVATATASATVAPPPLQVPDPLPDDLHLLAVLPMESLKRLAPPHILAKANRHPWYWPTTWALFDVGRSLLWECEPILPLIPEVVLRSKT